jgi:hypothetical protein
MAKKNAGFIMGAAGKPQNDMPTPGSTPKKIKKSKGKKKAMPKRGAK